MKSLKKIAQEKTILSELMTGRDKIETSDIIKYHPEGITIISIEPVQLQDDKFYVYIFKEEADKFAFSGLLLSKIFDGWMEEYAGDLSMLNHDINEQEVRVKLSEGKTKDKKQITNVEIL